MPLCQQYTFCENQLFSAKRVNGYRKFDTVFRLTELFHRQIVSSKLIGLADIVLQVIVVAPCDEILYQSSVLLKSQNYL